MSYQKVVLPKSQKEIGPYTFYECSNLTSAEVEGGVEAIGEWAFWKCEKLQDMDLSHVKRMGEAAFHRCSQFRGSENYTVNLSSLDSIPALAFSYGGTSPVFQHVVFSENLRYIGEQAFYYCQKLQEANLPEGLERMGDKVFYGCTSLANVHIPTTLRVMSGLMFYYTPFLESLTADGGVERCGCQGDQPLPVGRQAG